MAFVPGEGHEKLYYLRSALTSSRAQSDDLLKQRIALREDADIESKPLLPFRPRDDMGRIGAQLWSPHPQFSTTQVLPAPLESMVMKKPS